jgi:hypothetical protein
MWRWSLRSSIPISFYGIFMAFIAVCVIFSIILRRYKSINRIFLVFLKVCSPASMHIGGNSLARCTRNSPVLRFGCSYRPPRPSLSSKWLSAFIVGASDEQADLDDLLKPKAPQPRGEIAAPTAPISWSASAAHSEK